MSRCSFLLKGPVFSDSGRMRVIAWPTAGGPEVDDQHRRRAIANGSSSRGKAMRMMKKEEKEGAFDLKKKSWETAAVHGKQVSSA